MKTLFYVFLLFSGLALAQLGTQAPWMVDLYQQKSGAQPTYQEIKAAGDAYWQTHDKDRKGSGYKPYMRWLSQAQAYVKADGTLQSPQEIAQEMASMTPYKNAVNNSNWFAAGPSRIQGTGSWSTGQGRVNAITVDPNNSNIYYIGTPGGGVWKSTDAGVNWSPLSDFITEIGVSAIAVDPTNSNVIYIGTGDDDAGDTAGFGMLKSTDGGQTWNTTGLVLGGDDINEIYIDPTNNNTLFISSGNGFYRSTDGGATVTRTFTNGIRDMKLKPGDSNTIYIATSGGIYRSVNKGQTFTQVTTGLPSSAGRIVLAVTPANSNYLYALIVNGNQNLLGLYLSIDSGASFTRRDNGTDILESPQAWYDLALEVSPTNADLVYTGCLNVWRSFNGGLTFSKLNSWNAPNSASYTHADIHQIRFFGNQLFVSSDGGIYRSTSNGNAFTDLTAGAQIGQFYRVAVSRQSSSNIIGGLQDNGGQARKGNRWNNFYGADGMDCGVDPNNPDIRFGFIQSGGGLYFTNDGGNSLQGSINGPTSGNWITPLKVNSTGTIYAGYDRLYRVQGSSFVSVSSPFVSNIDVIEIDPTDDNIIYLAVNNRFYKSLNAGATFTNILNFPEDISSIEVSPNNNNLVYIATRTSTGQVYRSNDGGVNFSNITANLANLGKNTLAAQHQSIHNELYVGTTRGVYKYTEANNQWIPFDTNLPNANIRDLEINATDNILTAATYGRGIWQTAVTAALPTDDIGFVRSGSVNVTELCSSPNIDIEVINNGQNTITAFTLEYRVNGAALQSGNYTVNIPSQGTYTISLNGLNLITGANDLRFNLVMNNDAFSNNNTQILNINRNNSGVINDVYGFENRNFLVGNNSASTSVWERGTPAGSVLNQTASGTNAYATNLDGDYPNESIEYLYAGCYNLVGVTGPTLEFDMAFEIEQDWDLLYMQYSTDNGMNWNTLGTANDPNWYNSSRLPNGNNCNNCIGAQWTGTSASMSHYSYDLSAFNNESAIAFRFVLHTDQSVAEEGAVIDNFVVNGTLSNTSIDNNLDVSIYPNPSTGVFNIQFNNLVEYEYQVYDVSGKLIQTQKNINSQIHSIDLTGAARGMYFVAISAGDSQITKKIVIQ